jgi:aflatoxin B1 aldehyde reductase
VNITVKMAATQTETVTQPPIPLAVSDDLSPPQAKTNLKVVFGAMTLGKEGINLLLLVYLTDQHTNPTPGAEGARIHTVSDVAAVIDVLQQHGHNEIDTARVYGTSEALLGELKWQERGLVMDTKLNPRRMGPYQYSHKKEDLKRGLLDSLRALNAEKVDLFYLHAPDVSSFVTSSTAICSAHGILN